MRLIDVIRELDFFDEHGTIYASKPWADTSQAIVATEPDEGGVPAEVAKLGLKYFLEVSIARECLEGWIANIDQKPTVKEKCARIIKYATTDA